MSINHWLLNMAPQDKEFYVELGRRIASARKENGLTQVQLAEILGISQQTMAHYEVGRLRIAVSMIPILAKVLTISYEELLADNSTRKTSKRGPTAKLQYQIEQISELPRTKQKFVMDMLDTVIQQQG